MAVFNSSTLARMAKQIVEKPSPSEPLIKAEILRAKITNKKTDSDKAKFSQMEE